MKPWNPYAMTFHGQPLIGQTPPKLVVYGQPLTAQQGVMLQTAYNAFVGAARTSIVPNPTQRGRLLDGSPYTIECSQGVCTCTVWSSGRNAAEWGDVFSGIIFTTQDNIKTVAVNIGGGGISTGEWELKDVSAVPMNHSQQPTGTVYNNRMKPSPSVLLGGKERYVYRTDSSTGRYGNETVFHEFSAVLGLTKTRDALLVLKATPSIREVYVSDRIDMKTVFKDFGAPIAAPVSATFPNPPQVLFENQSTGDGETKLDGYEFSVPRSGKSVVFSVTERTGLLSAADIEVPGGGIRRYPLGRPFHYYASWAGGIIFVTYDYGRQASKYKNFKKNVLRCSRAGDAFTEPAVVYQVPAQQAHPVDTPIVDFSPVDGVGTDVASTAINVAEKYAPTVVPTAYITGDLSGSWTLRGSSTAAGAIGGRLTKTEKNHDVYPHHVGETLVLLGWTHELEYEEECAGTMNDVNLDGVWDAGHYPDSPSYPGSGAVLDSALTKRLTFTNEIVSKLKINSFYTLNNGERFFLTKYSYDEEASNDFFEEEIWTPRENATASYSFSTDLTATITYTVDREQRVLLAYDPEMDILCYTEVVFKATRSSWARIAGNTTEYNGGDATETTTSGAARPEVPSIYIKLRCKGTTQNVAVKPLNMPQYGDLSLLPATGVSPYATDGNIGTSQAFPLWSPRNWGTLRGFHTGLEHQELGPQQANQNAVRGIAPQIHIPIDVSAEYVKTPETGAAFLRVRIDAYGATEYHSYFVDSVAGVRRADNLFPGFVTDGSTAGVF